MARHEQQQQGVQLLAASLPQLLLQRRLTCIALTSRCCHHIPHSDVVCQLHIQCAAWQGAAPFQLGKKTAATSRQDLLMCSSHLLPDSWRQTKCWRTPAPAACKHRKRLFELLETFHVQDFCSLVSPSMLLPPVVARRTGTAPPSKPHLFLRGGSSTSQPAPERCLHDEVC